MNWVRAIASVLVLWSSTAWGATLTWSPDSAPDLAGYRVYHCSHLPCTKTSGTATLLSTLGKVASFNIGAPAVVQYYFLTAYDVHNNESAGSSVATYTPAGSPSSPPPPPHLVLGPSTAGSATLTWNANSDSDLAGYRVYQCTQQPCTHTSGHASLLVPLGETTNLYIGRPPVTHYYFITAYDLAHHESGPSNVVTFTPAGSPSSPPPPPPPHLVLGPSTAGSATLTWNANSDPDLAGYRVYQCTQQPCTHTSGHASLLVPLGKTTNLYIGRPPVTHYYFITAYDFAHHESGPSNVVTFTPAGSPPPSPPPPPPHLVLRPSTAGSATLTWNANSDPDLAGYRVYQCTQQPCTHTSGHASLLVPLGETTNLYIGRPPVTHYYFITAYDLAHHESGPSNVVTFTPHLG